MPYVETVAHYTPSAAWHGGNRIWITRGNRALPSAPYLGGLGGDLVEKVQRLTPDQRAEMVSLIERSIQQLAPAQRAKVRFEAGLGDLGLAEVIGATSAITGAAETSIWTAANIAGAINGLTQLGIGVAGLRLNQLDKQKQEDIASGQADAASALARAEQQRVEEMKKQTALMAAGGGTAAGGILKNKGLLIGSAVGVVGLGLVAWLLLRRRK